MRKIAYVSVLALALVAMVAGTALAGPGHDHGKKAMGDKAMGKCCVEAAEAGKGCCGKDADTVKAAYADFKATEAAKADMGKCCVAAMAVDKGCCGKDAAGLKAKFAEKVTHQKAAHAVKAEMHECCASALAEGKGCCGAKADELKADYDKKVAKAEKKMASK